MLGRDPDEAGWLAWVNTLNLGAQTRDQVVNSFLTGSEYQSKYYVNGQQPSNTQFLTDLYQNALNRAPDQSGLNGYLAELSSGTTRSQIVETFIGLQEFDNVQGIRIANDEAGFPTDATPVTLGGPNDTTGYRPLLTNYAQYTFVYVTDPRGAQYINSGFVWFVTTDQNGNVTQQCPVNYTSSGVVQVESTGQSSAEIVCTVSNGYVSNQGSQLLVSFYVTFSSSAPGNYTIMANATDVDGLSEPWTTLGTWGLYTPNTNPTPTFTLSGPTSVSLVAVSPNGGPVVAIPVTVTGYNGLNSTVSFYSATSGIVASGSGGPGTVTVDLYATSAGPTILTLVGSTGTQVQYLTIALTTTALPPGNNYLTITSPAMSPPPVDNPELRTAHTSPPLPVLARPLFERFELYAARLSPQPGAYSLSLHDYELLAAIAEQTRLEQQRQGALGHEPPPIDFWQVIERSQLTATGKSTLLRFLRDVVAPSVHLIQAAPMHPQATTPSNPCGTTPQAPSWNCFWAADSIVFYTDSHNTNHVNGSSYSWCTGTDASGGSTTCTQCTQDSSSCQTWVSRVKQQTFSLNGSTLNPNPNLSNASCTGCQAYYGWNGPVQPGTFEEQSFHQWTNGWGSVLPPFTDVFPSNSDPTLSCADPAAPSTSGLYCARTAVLWGQITIGVPTSTPTQATSVDYYVLANCPSPVGLYAFISFPNPPATMVTWNGGTPGSDNFHRSVPCTNPGNVPVSFNLNGYQMASATIHVINPVTINLVNAAGSNDSVALIGSNGGLQAQISGPQNTQVQLLATPPRVTFDNSNPILSANGTYTVNITPVSPSIYANDVTIAAYINPTANTSPFGSTTMTVASILVPGAIQNADTPPGFPPRIPPSAPTPITIAVQPDLTSTGQTLTVTTSGNSGANGSFAIGLPPCNASTQYAQSQAITSTTTVCLQGTAQTAPTGNINVPPTTGDTGGGNAGNLQLVVQAAGQTVASSGGFSVAAIPTGGWADTFWDSGGYIVLNNQFTPVNFNAQYYGIRVKLLAVR